MLLFHDLFILRTVSSCRSENMLHPPEWPAFVLIIYVFRISSFFCFFLNFPIKWQRSIFALLLVHSLKRSGPHT